MSLGTRNVAMMALAEKAWRRSRRSIVFAMIRIRLPAKQMMMGIDGIDGWDAWERKLKESELKEGETTIGT